ncbi:MAG TPA: hypothetical protein VK668_09620 [Mucilaginibacter sp.]|nr:hypothetical protein [Mucilaginibacter sp.]
MNRTLSKIWLFILAIPLITSCALIDGDWKELDLDAFKISIPKEWNYQKIQGEDSFTGRIAGSSMSLFFDCSSMGYANHLIPTEGEYLKQEDWLMDCPLYKPDITYTAVFNVKNEKARQMKEKGITDSSLVKVEADPCFQAKKYIHKPTKEQQNKFPLADYIADLTYKGDTVYLPVKIPQQIKSENILVDTTEKYIIKTIWPKIAGKGVTGIYIHSRSSNFNFQMNGKNLSAKDQELALKAFKTIKFKQ